MTEQVHLRQNENCGTMIMALREKFLSAVATLTKYSLQGTTQSRYLTGGVPPIRFSM